MAIHDILNRLEAQQKASSAQLILAPILSGGAIACKIAGVACRLKIEGNSNARGWGVVELISEGKAKWLRAATKAEREKYLALLPRVRFIALEAAKGNWAAFPAHAGDARFQMQGVAMVREVEAGIQPFDTFLTRFDGANFWFDAPDLRRPPAIAAYLRESLVQGITPEELRKKGLSSDERAAYALALYGPPREDEPEIALAVAAPVQNEVAEPLSWQHNATTARLGRSVAHGGASLVSYVERDGVYSVTYRFGERTHTSVVNARDLKVQTSGICLSGRDGDFDLTSLVGVMQEADKREPWQFDDHDY